MGNLEGRRGYPEGCSYFKRRTERSGGIALPRREPGVQFRLQRVGKAEKQSRKVFSPGGGGKKTTFHERKGEKAAFIKNAWKALGRKKMAWRDINCKGAFAGAGGLIRERGGTGLPS